MLFVRAIFFIGLLIFAANVYAQKNADNSDSTEVGLFEDPAPKSIDTIENEFSQLGSSMVELLNRGAPREEKAEILSKFRELNYQATDLIHRRLSEVDPDLPVSTITLLKYSFKAISDKVTDIFASGHRGDLGSNRGSQDIDYSTLVQELRKPRDIADLNIDAKVPLAALPGTYYKYLYFQDGASDFEFIRSVGSLILAGVIDAFIDLFPNNPLASDYGYFVIGSYATLRLIRGFTKVRRLHEIEKLVLAKYQELVRFAQSSRHFWSKVGEAGYLTPFNINSDGEYDYWPAENAILQSLVDDRLAFSLGDTAPFNRILKSRAIGLIEKQLENRNLPSGDRKFLEAIAQRLADGTIAPSTAIQSVSSYSDKEISNIAELGLNDLSTWVPLVTAGASQGIVTKDLLADTAKGLLFDSSEGRSYIRNLNEVAADMNTRLQMTTEVKELSRAQNGAPGIATVRISIADIGTANVNVCHDCTNSEEIVRHKEILKTTADNWRADALGQLTQCMKTLQKMSP